MLTFIRIAAVAGAFASFVACGSVNDVDDGSNSVEEAQHASSAHSNSPGNSGNHKTTICHRTHSATNPWVVITVDNHALPAHAHHGDIIPEPADGCPTSSTPPPPPPPPCDASCGCTSSGGACGSGGSSGGACGSGGGGGCTG